MFDDNEDIEKFNKLAENVSKLAETGTTLSLQLFSLMRQVKHIEEHLKTRHKDYKTYEASEDAAAKFVNMLANDEVSLENLDPDNRKLQ